VDYSDRLEQELIKYYTAPSRRVEADFFVPPGGGSQAYSAMKGAKFFMESVRKTGRVYESVLVWRFDISTFNKLVDVKFAPQQKVALEQKSTCAAPALENASPNDILSGAYLAYGTNTILAVEDHTLSLPGWTVPCVFNTLAGNGTVPCGKADGTGLGISDGLDDCHLKANFDWLIPPSKSDPAILDVVFPQRHDWFIYRGPMGRGMQNFGGPVNDCRYLEANFAGPSCDYKEAAKFVCKTWCSNQSDKANCMSELWPAFRETALNDFNHTHWESSYRDYVPEKLTVGLSTPTLPDEHQFKTLC